MQTFSICILGTLLIPQLAGAADLEYGIDRFIDNSRSFGAQGTGVIKPIEGVLLRQVAAVTHLAAGEFVLRRRFGPGQYGLYIGHKGNDSRELLSAFKPPPDGAEPLAFVNTKFYIRESDNPNQDIVNVYFDAVCIYVENAVRIYCRRGAWESIAMLTRQPATLSITSTPAGAAVYLNDRFAGVSPLYDLTVFSPSIVVRIKAAGYYLLEKCIVFGDRAAVTEHFAPSKMIPPAYGVCIDPESYSAEVPESVSALETRIRALAVRAGETPDETPATDTALRATAPLLRPQGEFEKSDDYFRMQQRAVRVGMRQAGSAIDPVDSGVVEELALLRRYRAELDNRRYQRYFMPAGLTIDRYDPDREYFPLALRIDDDCFHFSFQGFIAIPIGYAPDFKTERDCARLRLDYRNRIFGGQNNSSPRIYYEPAGLFVLYKGREYRLEGAWTFGPGESSPAQAQQHQTPSPGAS
jgi:hypothetical protein